MRHPYSTNSEERKMVPLYLGALSILLSWALTVFFEAIQWTPPLYVDVASVMLLYGLVYELFDRVAWKWKWLRRLGVVSSPTLEGTWRGSVWSDYEGENTTFDELSVEVIIKQDWTHIEIRLRGPSSHSRSLSASMVVTEDDCILIYEYLNEPNHDAVNTMQMHRGTARLELTGGDELQGDYYSGRGRQNTGGMKLRRTQS